MDVQQPPLAAEIECLVGNVDTLNVPEVAHLLHHQPGTAAGVEDGEIVPSWIPLLDPIEHDAAARRMPPMSLLGPVEDFVCVEIQAMRI